MPRPDDAMEIEADVVVPEDRRDTMWGVDYPSAVKKDPPSSEKRERATASVTEGRLIADGRWEDLIELYVRDVESAAGDQKARARLFQLVATVFSDKLDDEDQAFDALVEAFSADPLDPTIYTPLSALARKLLRWPELVETAKTLVAAETEEARILCLASHLATWYREEFAAPHLADAYLAKIREIDPTHPAVHRRMASVYRQQNDWEGQRDELERALLRAETKEAKRETAFALGYLFEGMARLDRAEERYKTAVAADPVNAFTALQGLERIYDAQEKYADLIAVLEQQVEVAADDDERTTALLRVAAIHEEHFVKPQTAAQKFEQVLALDPTKNEARDGVERCYRAMRAWDKLVRALDKRASITGSGETRARIFLQVADIQEQMLGDFAAAVTTLLAASRAHEKNKRALYELARLSEKMADFPAAAAFRAELAEHTQDPVKRAQIHAAIGDMLATDDRDPTAARLHFERAVDLDPTLLSAWQAIQRHAERAGEITRVGDCLQMRASYTESGRLKAVLYVDLAMLRLEELGDTRGAYEAYEQAILADPTNEVAAAALIDVYVRSERWREASSACELLVHAATRDREIERACELLALAGKIALAESDPPRALLAAVAAYDLMPKATRVREELIASAHRLLATPKSLSRATAELDAILDDPNGLGALSLVMLGEIAGAFGREARSIELFRKALVFDAYQPRAHARLAEAFAAQGMFELAANHKEKQALGSRDDGEQFDLLVEAGDIWAHRARDLEPATQAYEEALRIRPGDHRVLHTLLALYEKLQSWAELARTLRAIADLEDAREKKAKAVYALAQLVRDKLGDLAWAAEVFEETLELDPSRLEAFERIVRIHTERRDWRALEGAYRAMLKRLAAENGRSAEEDVELKHAICHQLGLVYRDRLGDGRNALASFRAAQSFKPDDEEDRKIITELLVLTGDLPTAVDLTRVSVARDPHDLEPYRELYALFLRQGAFDRAWCTVDLLAHLDEGHLSDEQANFYASYPATRLESVPGTLSAAAWDTHILHPDLDPVLTAIFRLATPIAVRAKLASLSPKAHAKWLGPHVGDDQSDRSYHVLRAFLDGAEILGLTAPALYARGGVNAPLNVPVATALAATPALFVSMDLVTGISSHETAFLVGKHIAELQPELAARALFTTISELKELLHMVVRATKGIPARSDGAFFTAARPAELDELRGILEGALASGAKLDVKRWSQLADMSTSRAGLVLAGTVKAAHRAVQGDRGPGDLTPYEWTSEISKFVVSDTYAELRAAICTGLHAAART
jgi:tetratricopeptide (TPR) repeat protein